MAKKTAFEATVLTHLEYIKSTQTEHDKKFDTLLSVFNEHKDQNDKRFNRIEKDIDTTKGFAKGAMAVGGLGIFGSLMNFLTRGFR